MTWRFVPLAALIAILFTSIGTHAAFHSRLGGQAYYDDQLDITWAADANINGGAFWDDQVDWVSNLFIDGVSGWRLPDMDVDNDGTIIVCDSGLGQAGCKDNEYAHMYYYGAGTAFANGIRFGLPGPFTGIQPSSYWSSTIDPPIDAWFLAFSNGSQAHAWTENTMPAWAVHSGDVGTVSLTGDLDGDGFVGINDLNIVLGNWNQNVPPANPLADPSGDGFVGIDDLNTVLGNWNAGTPPSAEASGAVPEPGSISILTIGSLILLRRHTS